MPSFEPVGQGEAPPIKMLYLGHTGAGKTGSLAALAAAGYEVCILDLDAGTDILRDYLHNPESPYRKPNPPLWSGEPFADRMSYVSVVEGYNILGTTAVPKAQAWMRTNQQLNNWTDGEKKYGNISSWPPERILVIDGLSRLCEAAMNFQLSLNNRLDKGPRVGTSGDNDYTQAYGYIRKFLDLLKSPEIKCQIIMVCHISFQIEMQSNPQSQSAMREQKGFPQTVGRLISPQVGQYFNHALRAKSVGTGAGTRRVIVSNNDDFIDLKNTVPLRTKAEYGLTSGLAEYFHTVRGPLTR